MACQVIKIVVISLLVLASCSRIVEGRRVKRVVGGSEVECDTQPRIGSLRNATSGEHLCGATLISQQFASTAAHCVRADSCYTLQLENFCEPKTARVLEIILHELYDKYSRAHDIALLRLEPLDWHGLNETLLPKYNFGATGECTVFGYGVKNTSTNELSETLRAATMRIVPLDECTELLGRYVAPDYDSGMMCAVGNGVDTCEGDSGGPLICEGLVEGISSYGLSCGVPGMPTVYTSVRAHLAWIQQHIGIQLSSTT